MPSHFNVSFALRPECLFRIYSQCSLTFGLLHARAFIGKAMRLRKVGPSVSYRR